MHKEGKGRKLSSLGRIQVEADDARYESHASLVAIYGTLSESGPSIWRRCLRHYIFTFAYHQSAFHCQDKQLQVLTQVKGGIHK